MTLPKYTASTNFGSRLLAEARADLVAMVPSSVAVRDLREPPKEPKGVRLAATMKIEQALERLDWFQLKHHWNACNAWRVISDAS
eukprot:scaffold385_cov38-Cyclotella_meneghiniana.AAC.6